jgi:hypothetical protein
VKLPGLFEEGSLQVSFLMLPQVSVSTSRSSNRTGAINASGSPTGFDSRPTNRPGGLLFTDSLVPFVTAEFFYLEVLGNMATLPTLGYFQNAPEVRPLSSTGITRFRRYYGPVRHPPRPGLSLAGVRLGSTHRWGFPCCDVLRVQPCPRPYPGGIAGGLVSLPDNPATAAFPIPLAGRLPRYDFRGLLGVHVSYGLAVRGAAVQPFTPKAPAVSLPPLPLRLLPAGATQLPGGNCTH